jgi:hypothetical protein
MNPKRRIIKLIIFVVLSLFIGGPMSIRDEGVVLGVIRIINTGLFVYMMIDLFSNMKKLETNRRKISKKIAIINILWGITFIIINILQYGTILKVLNILALGVIVSMIYALFAQERRSMKEMNIIRFGYIWIGFVLFIPVILILMFKGY